VTVQRYALTLGLAALAGLAIAFASYRTAEKPKREPTTGDAVLVTLQPRSLP